MPSPTNATAPLPARSRADRLRASPPRELATWAATAAAVLLGLALLLRYGSVLDVLRSQADLVTPLVLAEQAHRYPDAQIMTGNYGWWPGLWVVQGLRPLPGGMTVATYAPGLLSLAAIAALAAEARRLWTGLGALLVVLVALSVSSDAWTFLLAWSGRAPTWWATIALAIATIHVTATARPGPRAVAGAVLSVACAAIVLSGDRLALVATVAPLAAVAAVLARRCGWRRAVAPAGMAVATAAGSLVVQAFAESAGYVRHAFPVEAVPFTRWGEQAANALEGLTIVWRGPREASLDAAAGYLGAVLVLVVLCAGAAWVWRALATRRAVRRPAAEAERPEDALELSRLIWMAFWLTALAGMLAAFVVSRVAVDGGEPVVRYLYGVPFAAAALLSGLTLRRNWLVPTGLAILLALVAATTWARTAPREAEAGRLDVAAAVERIAAEQGVTRGYASYWSAYPIELASDGKLDMVPVGGCAEVVPYTLCPMYLHYVDRAFEPRDRPSFVLTDDAPLPNTPGAPPSVARPEWLTQLPAGLQPRLSVPVSDDVTMHLFDTDVAAALQPLPPAD